MPQLRGFWRFANAYFKEDEKGVATMCKVMEDMRNENTKQVMEKSILSIMNNLKLTVEQAMDALNVPQAQRDMYAGLIGRKKNTVKI
jgi:hypothetical protein